MFLTSAVSTETPFCFTLLSSSSLCVFSFHHSSPSKHFIRLQFNPKVGHFHFCFFPLVRSRLFSCPFSVSICRHECAPNRLCVYNIVTVLFTCCSLSYQFLSALIYFPVYWSIHKMPQSLEGPRQSRPTPLRKLWCRPFVLFAFVTTEQFACVLRDGQAGLNDFSLFPLFWGILVVTVIKIRPRNTAIF